MRIRMLTLAAGPWGSVQPGTELDLLRSEADMLIEGGYAVAVDVPAEDATAGPAEGATAGPAEDATAGPVEARGGDQPGASGGEPAPGDAGAGEPGEG